MWLTFVFAWLLCRPGLLQAQSLWEVTPYRIHVWVVRELDPRIPSGWNQLLASELPAQAEARVGAPWTLTASAAPDELSRELFRGVALDYETLLAAHDQLDDWDKLFSLAIRFADDGYRLQVREFDLASRQWSMAWEQQQITADQITSVAFQLMCAAFNPILRIDSIDSGTIVGSVRASGLARPEATLRRWVLPIEIEPGAVLKPIVRRADRNGRVGPGGVEVVAWTVLVAEEEQGDRIRCRWQSGYRQPFNTRRSSRVQQLAIQIRPRRPSTELRLIDRKQPELPLVGYEIHAKLSEDAPTRFIGRSDWQGRVRVDRDPNHPVQTLYVRNGNQLLGKLPVVPGDEAELVAPLRNDDLRLEAEGFLLGVQESLVDLVARREVLATRIRRHLADQEFDQAEDLIRQLQRLDTQEDFARRVQSRQSTLTSVDREVQQKVDELFNQTRILLGKYLDRAQVEQLQQALREARQRDSRQPDREGSAADQDQ